MATAEVTAPVTVQPQSKPGQTTLARVAPAAGGPARRSPVQPKRPRPLHANRHHPHQGHTGPRGWSPPSWLTDQQHFHGSAQGSSCVDPSSNAVRWCRRPVLSALVRATVLLLSLAATMASAAVASRLLPRPGQGLPAPVWWLAVLAVSTAVMLGVHRLARHLLPLADLLNLAMVFPDKAPDRLRLAYQAGALRHLEERLANARQHGIDDEPTKAAATILTLVAAMTAHDRRTRGHSERVRALIDLLAEELHLPAPDRERLRWAALLHDVGKLDTPPGILNKPGPLTPDEWRVLHRHPEDGARITAPLRAWLGPWAATIEEHHERWDGSGYPKGLAGTQISLGARIVAVADAYEVMTSPRPYRRAKSSRAAREEVVCCTAGTQFDPIVVRAFLTASLGRLRRVVGPAAWLAQLPVLVAGPKLATALAAAGRQVFATAGAATAVGVLTATGTVHPPAPTPAPPVPVPVAAATTLTAPRPEPRTVTPSTSPPAPPPSATPVPVSSAPTPVAPAPQTAPPPAPPVAARRVVTIDLSQLGIGGGVPPIEVSVPDLPVQLPPIELPPLGTP